LGEPPVLFLGEGPGSARYLEGALQTAFQVTRVFGSQSLAESDARLDDFRLFLLSDYPAHRLSAAEQERIVELVEQGGRGLVMIGGWSSFAGPRGTYHGSRLAELLPVELSPTDDRTNTPLGTVLIAAGHAHPAVAGIQGQEPCVVVGYNDVRPRDGAETLIQGYRLGVAPRDGGPTPRLERAPTPMLSVWERGRGRVAAFAPDVSPHWAGGIVDWGSERLTLPTGSEVGHLYRAFLVDLCQWLIGAGA
jgi:hypothetical protein